MPLTIAVQMEERLVGGVSPAGTAGGGGKTVEMALMIAPMISNTMPIWGTGKRGDGGKMVS
ncbi:hypothetical protein [Porphyromonas macacae]|uniref:hypothetical protein n=1 Tax=Porphyromonas macacae TaxID=28115 RepID=UPI001650F544|nr:hypothetical protein [Porphyromonas macacae]